MSNAADIAATFQCIHILKASIKKTKKQEINMTKIIRIKSPLHRFTRKIENSFGWVVKLQ